MIFTPRLTAPYETNLEEQQYWWTTRNGYYPDYQMPNCTAYAWGRAMEIGDKNLTPISSDGTLGNANTWGKTGYLGGTWTKGTTPKLGAIAVWDDGEAGHDAIVEVINDDGSYTCSNSGYYRPIDVTNWHYFFLTECTSDNKIYYNGAYWSSYTFLYFIYPPYIGDTPTPTPTTTTTRKKFNFLFYQAKKRQLDKVKKMRYNTNRYF